MSKVVQLLAASAIALGTVASYPAVAAAPPPVAGISGWAQSSVAGCPYIIWRLARHPDGKVTGIISYSDLSGQSTAVGNITQSGLFHIVLKSAIGEGPSGVIDGQRSNGEVVADLKGPGCANFHVARMAEVPDINQVIGGGG
jgi:hypothetical protein